MATVDKAFRVKNGLVVEGATATVNTHDVITKEIFDAKGDLLVGTGSNTGTRVALGTNGYVLTADSNETNGVKWAAAPAVGAFETSIVFEGTTANDFETTLQVTDPTADRTITFPDVTGTVITNADSGTVTSAMIENGTIVDGDISASAAIGASKISGTAVTQADSGTVTSTMIADGTIVDGDINASAAIAQSKISGLTTDLGNKASASDLTTHTGATDAHGATGAVVGTTNTQTLTGKTLTSPIINGDGVVFEGATANEFETTLTVVDPTADRTITLPNVTGTVVTTGDTGSVTNTMLAGSIANEKLSNSAITINGTSTSLGGSRTLGSDDIAEGSTNKYFTDERAQDAIGTVVGNGLDYDDTSGAISVDPTEFTLNAVGAPTGDVSMATYKITGLGTPTNSTDAATKAYVDAVSEGLHIHEAARAAILTNIAIATALENGDTAGGVTLATGDRILLNGQTTTSENGIYVVQASGQALRATDFDTATEVDSGDFIFVTSGTYANTGWVQTLKPATIGTDPISFTQFSGAGTFTAGNGLTLTGTVFSIDTTITSDLSTAQTLTNKSISGSSNTLTNIPNNALSNSAITINGTSVSLGGSRTLGSDDISEGSTNKYFTDERAQDAVGTTLGTGLSYNDTTGAISNSGVLSITGTSNQVTADVSTGAVTLSLPQSIHTAASPTFAGLSVGSGSVTAGSLTLTDALIGTATTSLSTTSATVVDSWSATTYSSAKYIVQMKNGSDIEVLEVLVTVNGANNVYITEYADIQSNAQIGTTDADYSGGNVRLLVTATDGTTVKVHKTLIEA
jgi:hypothetical protein